MGEGGHGEALHIVGHEEVAPVRQRLGAGRAQKSEGAPGTHAERQQRRGAGGRDQGHDVVEHRLVRPHRLGFFLEGHHVFRLQHGHEHIEGGLTRSPQHRLLVQSGGIADADAEEKAIELGLGQRKRADVLDRILCGDDQERLRKREPSLLDADHSLAHGLEQSRLGLRSGAVDLIREQNVGEDRTGDEFEFLLVLVVDRHADDIRGQKIARKLNALKPQ